MKNIIVRAAILLIIPLASPNALAAEIAIKCVGESTTFRASPNSQPLVRSEAAPDQIFIIDDDKKIVWRWLPPLNKRDQLCNDASCISVFTNSTIDLFWQPKSDILQWQDGLKLDRLSGHSVWYFQSSRAGEINHVRVDMMCSPTEVPAPSKQRRAF